MTCADPAAGELRWLVNAPPLLRTPASPHDADTVLRQCASEPEVLARAGATLAAQPRARRLGHHFENLVAALVDASEHYSVEARNLPLRLNGVTLGELDLLIRDHHSGDLMHWELALKFYLGQPGAPMGQAWPGPNNPNDQLTLKIEHLLERQLPRAHQPAVRELLAEQGLCPDHTALLTRGRLFQPQDGTVPVPPEVHPDHQTGHWRQTPPPADAVPIPKAFWHCPEIVENAAPQPEDGALMYRHDGIHFHVPAAFQ